jgi:hypothetical protein
VGSIDVNLISSRQPLQAMEIGGAANGGNSDPCMARSCKFRRNNRILGAGRVQIYAPGPTQEGRGFKQGHAKVGGRQKGSKNRFGGDLREAVVAGIQATGHRT